MGMVRVFHEVKLGEKGIRKFLSSLEADILETLWEKGEARVKEIYEEVRKKRRMRGEDADFSQTTINLYCKKLLDKGLIEASIRTGKGGLYYVFRPKVSRQEFENMVVRRVLSEMIRDFPEASYFFIKEAASTNLEELKRKLRELEEEGRREGK
ncbi:hypothetical protein DRN84_04360 [Candidatus Geothermarchaeota archaeon]|nr:MAG: hypothetical protein DRN84_04360 [Candidatus Geothermarchaeota archaeon]